jgi:predicted membrane protein
MVLGLVQFSQRKSGLSALVGTAWLFLGGIFLARNLGWLSFRTRDLMPLFWVAIGAVIVWRALAGRRTSTAAGDSSAVVNGLAVLGGIERASSSQAFEGGQLTAIMGGFELDLRNARSTRPEVVIDVLAVWGGVTVRVPPDWAVDGQVVPVLGGFDDKTQPVAKPSQRLVLRGMAIMGGIEAKN